MPIVRLNKPQVDRKSSLLDGLSNLALNFQQGQQVGRDRAHRGQLTDAQIEAQQARAANQNSQTDLNRDVLAGRSVDNIIAGLEGIGISPDQAGGFANLARADKDIKFNDLVQTPQRFNATSGAVEAVNKGDFDIAQGLNSIGIGDQLQDRFSTNGQGITTNKFSGDTQTSPLTDSIIGSNNALANKRNEGVNTEISRQGALGGIANQQNAQAKHIITGLGAAEAARKPLNSQDAKEIGAAREASDKAVQLQSKLEQVESLIDSGFDTGPLAPARELFSNIGEATGFSDGQIASQAQQFDSITKELGAETLALFGGSDTEKELEVALRTQPSANRQESANKAIIQRKIAASKILQQKPAFQEQWLTANGSLSARNAQGQTFSDTWLSYQRESFGNNQQTNQQQGGGQAEQAPSAEGQALTATNPQTGEKVTSTDGGKTWNATGGGL